MQLEDYLLRNAQIYGDKTAVICAGSSITYTQLYKQALAQADTYSSLPGMGVVVRASQSIEFIVTYFAIHLARKAAVPLEKDTPDEIFYSITDQVNQSVIPAEVADVLFTTGTTGKSKGTMISHSAIIANAENLIDAQHFSHDLTFVISGPLNHIGSLSKVWPVVITGGTLIITDGMKDQISFLTALGSAPKTATFLVPASIRMLLQFSRTQFSMLADNIDFIETGAAPISQSDMEELRKTLPHSRLYNTYASTETGIVCTYDFSTNECVAGCLGRPMKHAQLHITPQGTVACSGATLMTGYLNDAELTATLLRDGVLYTNDHGQLDSEGRLCLTGRSGDVINIGGYKVNPVEVEGVALSYSSIADCICIPACHPVLGVVLRLLVVMSNGADLDKKALAQHLSAHLERYKVPTLFSVVDKIARTYNGKLNRKHYLDSAD